MSTGVLHATAAALHHRIAAAANPSPVGFGPPPSSASITDPGLNLFLFHLQPLVSRASSPGRAEGPSYEARFLLSAIRPSLGGDPSTLTLLDTVLVELHDSPLLTVPGLEDPARLTIDDVAPAELASVWSTVPGATAEPSIVIRASPLLLATRRRPPPPVDDRSIQAAPTGIAAFFGPVAFAHPQRPIRLTSTAELQRHLTHDPPADDPLPHAVSLFFENGGRTCWVVPTVAGREEQALADLEHPDYDEIAIINAPGATPELARLVVEHCDRTRKRFAVVDAQLTDVAATVQPRNDIADSAFASFTMPWLLVADPAGGTGTISVPPGGAVCGQLSTTDRERGVWKAPAGRRLNGVLGVTEDIPSTIDTVERSVNPILTFPGRGHVVWGARTLSSGAEWKYINVRRLGLFIENSISRSLDWVTFEPNSGPLWASVTEEITRFLTTIWRQGGLEGERPENAFFVRADRTTMTQDDLVNGRLVIQVGAALTRPSAFVVLTITKSTVEAVS